MGKSERNHRAAKAQKSSYSRMQNKIKKKGKHKGMLPQSLKKVQKRVEEHGFDLTNCNVRVLEKTPEEVLRQMSFVRGQGKHGNKQQLIKTLLSFKLKIEDRDVREGLYAQYLARCAKVYEHSSFAARGNVLKAIKLGGTKLKPTHVPNPR